MIQQPNQNDNIFDEQECNRIISSLYWKEVDFEYTLKDKYKKSYRKYNEPRSCYGIGLIGNIIKAIVVISVDIVFVIVCLCLLISNNKAYKNYRDLIKINPLSNYEIFWCNFGKYEKGILISYFILLILVLAFEIISLLIHKQKLIIKIGTGLLYKGIIFINFIFYLIFTLYFSFFMYLFSLSILIIVHPPLEFRKHPTIFDIPTNNTSIFDTTFITDITYNITNITNNTSVKTEKTPIEINFEEQYILFIIYIVFLFIIWILNFFFELLDNSMIYYLGYDFVDLDETIYDREVKIKETKIYMNGENYNVKIKNKTIYLSLFLKSEYKNEYGLILYAIIRALWKAIPFKQILIEGKTNDYIYIKSLDKSINDQLSITDWKYPAFNDCYKYLTFLFDFILFNLNLSFSFFKLHLTNDKSYKALLEYISNGIIEKPKYYYILKIYGNFEKIISDSRFAFDLIIFIIVILFMLKRIYYGGFLKYIYLNISYILSIIFIILNVINIILTFLLILFSAMCHVNFYSLSRDDYLLKNKILAQCCLNSFYLFYMLYIIKKNVDIKIYLKNVINNYHQLSQMNIDKNCITIRNQKIDIDKIELEYIDLNNNICKFEELMINNFPKLCYSRCIQGNNNIQNIRNEGNVNINGVNLENNQIQNELNNNIIVNKDENIDVNLEITQNPEQPIEITNNIGEQILTSKEDMIKKIIKK